MKELIDFEYAIFDMDGTLIDSMKQWRETGSIFLRQRGIHPTPELLKIIRTVSYKPLSHILNERFGFDYTGITLENCFFDIMKYSYKHTVSAKDGVYDFLCELKERGIKMCVATGTCQEITRYILTKLQLIDFFEFVITCPEVGKDKHSPLIFNMALEKLGSHKNNTVIFEDSLTAIKAAAEDGFRVIGVYDETSINDKRSIKKIAERYIYSMAEFIPLSLIYMENI